MHIACIGHKASDDIAYNNHKKRDMKQHGKAYLKQFSTHINF